MKKPPKTRTLLMAADEYLAYCSECASKGKVLETHSGGEGYVKFQCTANKCPKDLLGGKVRVEGKNKKNT